MEKIEYFLSKTLNLKDTVAYEIIMDLSGEIIDAFKNHLYQLSMSSFSILLLIHQFYSQQLSYLKYTGISDSFVQYLFPAVAGAVLFNTISSGESVGGRNRFIVFLCSIPLPAFGLEYILSFFNLVPNSGWYFAAGFAGYPVLVIAISIYDYARKELPTILKKIVDIALSAFSNRVGANKEDKNIDQFN
jgi:hypothetical protein